MATTNLHRKMYGEKFRGKHRAMDVAESYNLLIEIACYDPTVQQCLKIIESFLLSKDILVDIDDRRATASFERFVNRYYKEFCQKAIKTMFVCGFVPWFVRKLKSGDVVPDVLPLGSFSWETTTARRQTSEMSMQQRAQITADRAYGVSAEVGSGKKRTRSIRDVPVPEEDEDQKIVNYKIKITNGAISTEDIHIYEFVAANYKVSENSIIYASVDSPLAHCIPDYKRLRDAQERRSYADAWNTTARVTTTFKPAKGINAEPTQFLLDNYSELNDVWWQQREKHVEQEFEGSRNHDPTLFQMPRDHDIQLLGSLTPCEDVQLLIDKYKRDISSIMGIPHDMIMAKSSSQDSTNRAQLSGRLFTANMQNVSRHLSYLLEDVYKSIYGGNSKFYIGTMPRLDVESVSDLKILFDIGCINPITANKIAENLLTSEISGIIPRQKILSSINDQNDQAVFNKKEEARASKEDDNVRRRPSKQEHEADGNRGGSTKDSKDKAASRAK